MSGHPAKSRTFHVVTAMVGALLLSSGFAVMAGVGSASAADEECVPNDAVADSWTEWTDEGAPMRTEENAAPDVETDLVRYVFAGETEPEVIKPATSGFWSNFQPNDSDSSTRSAKYLRAREDFTPRTKHSDPDH